MLSYENCLYLICYSTQSLIPECALKIFEYLNRNMYYIDIFKNIVWQINVTIIST